MRAAARTPPGQAHFASAPHRVARDLILGAILQRQRFIALTGENGIGKTAVVEAVIAAAAGPAIRFMRAGNAQPALLTLDRLLHRITGGDAPVAGEDALAHVMRVLAARRRGEDQVVLVVEEAETLAAPALALLESLPAAARSPTPVLQVLFVGGPAFWSLLGDGECRGLGEQIATRATVGRLTDEEVGRYVKHRLQLVGWQHGDAPGGAALLAAARNGEGNPSRINALLEQALRRGEREPAAIASPDPGPSQLKADAGAGHSRWLKLLAGLAAVAAIVLITGRVFYRGLPHEFAAAPGIPGSPTPAVAPTPASTPTPASNSTNPGGSPEAAPVLPAPVPPAPMRVAPIPAPTPAPLPATEPPPSVPVAAQPPRAVEAPQPAAAKPEGSGGSLAEDRVVIHYRGDSASGLSAAERIAALLPAAGSTETRAVAEVPRSATIRFFFTPDEAAARELAAILGQTGTVWSVRDFTWYEPKPRAGTLEVWLPGHS